MLATNTPLLNQALELSQQMQTTHSAAVSLKSIFRFKWTLLTIFVLVTAPIVAAVWTQVVPDYRAYAEVRIRPIIPRLVFRTEDNGAIPFYTGFINTEVNVIRSLPVLLRVLDQQELRETDWYKNHQKTLVEKLRGNQNSPIERLRDNLSVKPRRNTEIIDVAFWCTNPKEAKLILNTILDQYIKYVRQRNNETEDVLDSQLADRYKSIENEILGHEKICSSLTKSLGTTLPDKLIAEKKIILEKKQTQLAELRNIKSILEWRKDRADTDDSNDVTGSMKNQSAYYEDVEWRKLDIDVRTKQHNIENSLITSNHQDMVKAKKDLEFAKELIRRREAQLDGQWQNSPKNIAGLSTTITQRHNQLINGLGAPITNSNMIDFVFGEGLRSVEDQLTEVKQMEQILTAELAKEQAEVEELFATAQLLDKEENELLQRREVFDAVRHRLDQKRMERDVPGSISILTQAFVSSMPQSDRRFVFTAMAIMMGLSIGGCAAYIRASRNQAIYAPKDMPYPIQALSLGNIPFIRKSVPDKIRQTQSQMEESVRVVRTTLLSRLNDRASTTILVTSSAAGTGKSTFTMKLGESLAQAGKKVLMIDADFRKMTLTRSFNLSGKLGFTESLCSRFINKRHIFPTETSGLSIMPAGKQVGDAKFEQIANGAFKACIGQLSKQFNIVLLDSVPILPVADAVILSNQVDGTIMVEREIVTRRANVTNAIARIGSAGGYLFGTVFVGSGNGEDYGYEYYDSCNH